MERIELYLNSKNRPVIDVYKHETDEVVNKHIKNYDALDTIDKISTYKIQNVFVTEEDIILKYNGFVVNIREYKDVFKLNEMKQIKSIISKHYNHQNQKKVKKKKVVRKNKHTGSKIIAATLVLSLIATGTVMAQGKMQTNSISASAYSTPEQTTNLEQTTTLEQMTIEEPETKEVKIVETTTNNIEQETDIISLNYNDRSNTQKARITASYYGEKIEKYAEMYGLDAELMVAIATQERGIHGEKMDAGGATGLMQIQNSVWRNQTLTAYNYQTKKYETIKVSENELSNIDYNIKVGCMIFQNALRYMDYNIVAAVQCYNMGYGNMKTILNAYSNKTGKSIKQILSNKTDTEWLKYRSLINQGDRKYVEHVFSWMLQDDEINILNQDEEINVAVTSIHK